MDFDILISFDYNLTRKENKETILINFDIINFNTIQKHKNWIFQIFLSSTSRDKNKVKRYKTLDDISRINYYISSNIFRCLITFHIIITQQAQNKKNVKIQTPDIP